MSCYEWERGEVVLPSQAARTIRAKLMQAESEHFDRVEAEIASFYEHKGSGGRTPELFNTLLNEWERARYDAHLNAHGEYGMGGYRTPSARSRAFSDASSDAYHFAAARGRAGNLGKPQKRDVKALRPKRAKTGPVTFSNTDASVTLDGNKLIWDVPDNNHAVEHARDSALGRAVFDELDRVQWGPRTGGKIVGNDEYNQDNDREGGGANYATGQYGPLGDPHFVTAQQQARVEQSARTFRAKPGNSGLCGRRTMINGKQTGPPCRNSAYGCPVHRNR